MYSVIDQEQQSTGQFRAALSRGLEHALVKNSQPQPPAAEETKTCLPAVTTLLEPRIPQKECSRRNGVRIKGPTPTPSPSPHPQPRGRRRPVPAEAPTAQPLLPRRRLVAATRQRPRSVPGPGDSHRQATPDRDHPPYCCQRPSDGRRACRPWRPRVANAAHRRRLPLRMSSRCQTRSTRNARPVCVGMSGIGEGVSGPGGVCR